jgi:hypothetical protein
MNIDQLLNQLQVLLQNQTVMFLLVLWEIWWKGKALWMAARTGRVKWFIVILVINSIGIIPLLYLYVFSKKGEKSVKTIHQKKK